MTDPEVRKALQQIHEAKQGLEQLQYQQAADMAKVLVVLSMLPELEQKLDAVIAWVHGANGLPALTPGAQAILAKKGTTNEPF